MDDPAPGAPALVGQLYREHATVLIARLLRRFGVGHLDTVEAAIADAFESALEVWRESGPPRAPLAWLTTVATNAARDRLRRTQRIDPLAAPDELPSPTDIQDPPLPGEIADEQLRMMFVACHPGLPMESRIALALRTLCALSVEQIARLHFAGKAAIDKRLVRARSQLRELDIDLELPRPVEWLARLDSVHSVLYALFSEGYAPHSEARAARDDLCAEAIGLARLLAQDPRTQGPTTFALLSLFCLQASRVAARYDPSGTPVDLEAQDRSRWNRALIAEGMVQLERASEGPTLSAYHLQAGIAACHAIAPSFAATRWDEIVALYDRLAFIDDSPVIALHRAIAVGFRDGPVEALALVDRLVGEPRFASYPLLWAARGDALRRLGRRADALADYRRARSLAHTEEDRRFLDGRIGALAEEHSHVDLP